MTPGSAESADQLITVAERVCGDVSVRFNGKNYPRSRWLS